MNESMYRYMDVGIIHFMAYPSTIRGEGPILETIKAIADDDYFTLIEITHIKDEEIRQQAKELLNIAGMKIAYGAQPVLLTQKLSLNPDDQAERRKAIDAIKASIDEAYFMGAKGCAVLAGKDPGEAQRNAAKKLLVESIVELCEYSKSKGNMPILLETFDRLPFGKNAVVGPTTESVSIADEVRSKVSNFGLMLDLSHLPLLGESARESLTAAKDHLMHVHIGNCVMRDPSHPAYGDEHPRFGIPGGENDVDELAEFLSVLFDIGYLNTDGPKPVSFEVKPIAAFNESSETVIAASKRTLNKAWALV